MSGRIAPKVVDKDGNYRIPDLGELSSGALERYEVFINSKGAEKLLMIDECNAEGVPIQFTY